MGEDSGQACLANHANAKGGGRKLLRMRKGVAEKLRRTWSTPGGWPVMWGKAERPAWRAVKHGNEERHVQCGRVSWPRDLQDKSLRAVSGVRDSRRLMLVEMGENVYEKQNSTNLSCRGMSKT